MNKKENMALKAYGSPSTKRTQVELEGNLCGSIETTGENQRQVNIQSQEVITSGENDFSNSGWGGDVPNN